MKYFDDVKLRLTIRGICGFEQMANKSFFDLNDGDLIQFMYCVIVACNDFNYTYDTFLAMCNNKKVMDFLVREYEKMFKIIEQYNKNEQPQEERSQDSGETHNPKISDICADLIIRAGLDAHYVYNELQLWELELYVKKFEEKEKQRMEENRLWTYFTVMPHCSKKIEPQDLVQFAWEKEDKKSRALKDLEAKKDLIKAVLGGKPKSDDQANSKDKSE